MKKWSLSTTSFARSDILRFSTLLYTSKRSYLNYRCKHYAFNLTKKNKSVLVVVSRPKFEYRYYNKAYVSTLYNSVGILCTSNLPQFGNALRLEG